MDISFLAVNATLVAVIIGLVSTAKMSGLPTKYAPLLSLLIGVVFAFIFPLDNIGKTILLGIVQGLSASGLYSGAKATINND